MGDTKESRPLPEGIAGFVRNYIEEAEQIPGVTSVSLAQDIENTDIHILTEIDIPAGAKGNEILPYIRPVLNLNNTALASDSAPKDVTVSLSWIRTGTNEPDVPLPNVLYQRPNPRITQSDVLPGESPHTTKRKQAEKPELPFGTSNPFE